MKYFGLIIFTFFLGACTSENGSQNTDADSAAVVEEEPVYSRAEEMPRFPGCEEKTGNVRQGCANQKMLDYVRAELKYPEAAKTAGLEGQAVVGFNIEKDGTVSEVEIIRDPGSGIGEEAARIVRTFPKFIPAKEKGETVIIRYNLPIRFKLN